MRTSSATAAPHIIPFPKKVEEDVSPESISEPKVIPVSEPVTQEKIQAAKPQATTTRQDAVLNVLLRICYASIDSAIRCPLRIIESTYNLSESPLVGTVYRAATEAFRHGTVSFIRDPGGHKDNYSNRILVALKQLVTRASENVIGFLAFKPNTVISAFGRMGAGFANMFVRLLPRMGFVAKGFTPSGNLSTKFLANEFLGRVVMRALPRSVSGMLGEQFGINMLMEFKPLNKVINALEDRSTEPKPQLLVG